MKVALVHDDFIQSGGAESLFATIASLYPDAPIYTSLISWNKLPSSIDKRRIKTSFIQKIPFAPKLYKLLLPLYPLAFESFDFSNYDLVISSTTRFAKAIITKPQTVHICYINNIPRFLWDKKAQKDYLPFLLGYILKPLFLWLKRWDKTAARRVDFYIANSQNVQNRLRKYYGRQSEIIYPFADLNFYKPAKIHNWQLKSQNYYLVVSRLVKWKKIDLAMSAAKDLGLNLKIVGEGPDKARLRKMVNARLPTRQGKCPPADEAGKMENSNKIEFLGRVEPKTLRDLYQNCRALILTQEEDFGISAVEAQACGVPVIAYHHGGQGEIIKDNQTGLFFKKQTPETLQDAILRLDKLKWTVTACRKNAQRFSKTNFTESFKRIVARKIENVPQVSQA